MKTDTEVITRYFVTHHLQSDWYKTRAPLNTGKQHHKNTVGH